MHHNTTHCKTLQHTGTHCNTLQHTTTHCNTLLHANNDEIRSATHCNALQYIVTHCNTLQHTATHCNTLQHTSVDENRLLNLFCKRALLLVGRTFVCVCVYIYIYMYMCACVCLYIDAYVLICVCVYMYIHIYTYAHTLPFSRKQIAGPWWSQLAWLLCKRTLFLVDFFSLHVQSFLPVGTFCWKYLQNRLFYLNEIKSDASFAKEPYFL